MEKPGEIFDRVAEWADLSAFVADPAALPLLGVVSGRRRQGKTLLLGSLVDVAGGLYVDGTEAVPAEQLHRIGEIVGTRFGAPGPVRFPDWRAAVDGILDLPVDRPTSVVIDEFPYLVKGSPELPSILQSALDLRRRTGGRPVRLLLCGSALSFMGRLLGGGAPLRGRAGLELVVPTLDYRLAAEFWGIGDPYLAVLTHAIVGGTPAYRREYVRGDAPASLADFDAWVQRAPLNSSLPIFREARYLLAEEVDFRDPALYHSVLAAVAEGNNTRGGIAGCLERKATDVAHPLTVLEDAGLLAKQADVFRPTRPIYRITEPLITFYHAVMRPAWRELERRRAEQVWRRSRPRFLSRVVGPHFEELCRQWASDFADPDTWGGVAADVGHGVVNDPEQRTTHEIDVVVLGEHDGGPRKVLALGEAKWGEVMGTGHIDRLTRVRDLLGQRGFDTRTTRLTCYSGKGFTAELIAAAGKDDSLVLVDVARLYYGE
ncbi:ATPase AAA [Acrocarpospora corrugata]|uniref:ATPase AAA n=1 Tax=Acrocarpospora corrugata TaxID=35763 RepID=A0A5M3VV94_9ACTN|nr:DUF234 domain-containing protein [Acrocarpospora corrugata]GES00424.1 ATPase AAA [Acrocarpospora corrugata]